MMRLIDADALSEKIGNMKNEITHNRGGYRYCSEDEKNEWDKLDGFDSLVCDAPTVDAVVLPCKMGDVVWGIKAYNNGALRAKQGVVNEMYFGEDMRICICVRNICRGEWGKKVFATKEEAEKAIERMGRNERKAD